MAKAEDPRTLARELGPLLESASADDLWRARSLLHAWRAKAPAKTPQEVRERVDTLLDLTREFHGFRSEVGGWVTAKDLSELATLFDIGAIGVLAVQDLVGGEGSIPKLALGGLSEALIVLGSTQYIKGDRRMLEAAVDVHLMHLHDRFWALPHRFRGTLRAAQVDEVRDAMEAFFAALRKQDVPVEARMAVAHQLYVVLGQLELAALAGASG